MNSIFFAQNPDFQKNCLGSCPVPFAFDAFQNFKPVGENLKNNSGVLENLFSPESQNNSGKDGSNSFQNGSGNNSSSNGNSVNGSSNGNDNPSQIGYFSNSCLQCNSLNPKVRSNLENSGGSSFSINNTAPSKFFHFLKLF